MEYLKGSANTVADSLSCQQNSTTAQKDDNHESYSEGFSELDYDIHPDEIQQMQKKDNIFGLKIDYLQNDNLPPSEKIAYRIRKES